MRCNVKSNDQADFREGVRSPGGRLGFLSGGTGLRRLMAAFGLGALALLAGCERTGSTQIGFRGVGMEQLSDPKAVAASMPLHQIPAPEDRDPLDPEAPALKDVFKNVQVLNDLSALDFSRLMAAMTTWVSPEEGCEYCHNPKNLASDEKYTKVVARRMLQMTRQINNDWKQHVAGTGVTCWTCHRGQAVPSGDWFRNPGPQSVSTMLGDRAGQNTPGVKANGGTSLPFDALSTFLNEGNQIRVQGTQALADGSNRRSIKQAEWTYSLMIYMSKSLGVNCTYCHNTRALASWNESTPQRATAWYGIRLVRELNNAYLTPLKPLFPAYRLSAEGDAPKVGCETCHKGAFKPLYGVSMLGDYPELGAAGLYEAFVATQVPLPSAPADIPEPAVKK